MKPSALLLAAALACTGCGGVWRQLKSEHFRVTTDLSLREAHYAVVQYEKLYRALQLYFGEQSGPKTVVDVVLFQDINEFTRHTRENLGGYFTGGGTHITNAPLIVTQSMYGPAERTEERAFAAHELTHLFAHGAFRGSVPLWLNEGLARYFETLEFDGDQLCRGAVNSGLVRAVEKGKPRSLEDLWRWRSYSASIEETRSDYAYAWAWTHYLLSEHSARFEQVRLALTRAEHARGAFDAAFAGVTDLEPAFEVYKKRDSFPVFRRDQPPVPDGSITENPLPRASMLLLKAAIALEFNRLELAKEELRDARELGANGPDLLVLETAAKAGTTPWDALMQASLAHPAPEALIPSIMTIAREQGALSGDMLKAVAQVEQQRPLDSYALAWKAELLTDLGRADEGLAAALAAAALNASNDHALRQAVMARVVLGRCDEAAEAFRRLSDKTAGHIGARDADRMKAIDARVRHCGK